MRGASRRPRCWGVYRELAHSPGRESDDAEILRATAGRLALAGFDVELKSPEELPQTDDASEVPRFLFAMCERPKIVERLAAWERQGVVVVNRPEAIRNTDRERTIARFCGDGVPFPASVLVATGGPIGSTAVSLPCWVKRGDVHAVEIGDVAFVRQREDLSAKLAELSTRGIGRAVLQEHVPGDLIKFYGVAGSDSEGAPLSWFQWFYHRDQTLSHHPFEAAGLRAAAARAADALGLEVFGGDAIAAPDGRTVLIDLNAWPSFALYRETAAGKIADRLAARFAVSE